MSDLAPQPTKSGQAANKNQLILVVVLGAVLLLALVFLVIKPFDSGDSSSSAPPAVTETVDETPEEVSTPTPEVVAQPTLPPPPARVRDPFAPLR